MTAVSTGSRTRRRVFDDGLDGLRIPVHHFICCVWATKGKWPPSKIAFHMTYGGENNLEILCCVENHFVPVNESELRSPDVLPEDDDFLETADLLRPGQAFIPPILQTNDQSS